MRILIYSAEFGGYEKELYQPTPPPLRQDVMYSYVRYAEDEDKKTGVWHLREPFHLSREFMSKPQYRARFHKIDPYNIIHCEEYDFTIWVDASMTLLADPMDLIKLLGDKDLMTFRHRHRNTLEEEGKAVVQLKGQDPRAIEQQIQFYRQGGYNDTVPLPETGLIVRRVNEQVRKFNQRWWDQIKLFSVRDQMSFGFSAWKTGLKVGFFPGHVRSEKYNILHHHRRPSCRTRL